jgi:hypothetical protein
MPDELLALENGFAHALSNFQLHGSIAAGDGISL